MNRSNVFAMAARLFDASQPPIDEAELARTCVITTRKPKLVPRTRPVTFVVVPKHGRIRTTTKTVGKWA
jgi:hypothetical protein